MNMEEVINIQWFPGHMAKAKRIIEKNLPLVDLVIEILDSRAPISSANQDVYKILRNKPKLVLLNKSDLADDVITHRWKCYYNSKNVKIDVVDSKTGKGLNRINTEVKEILKEDLEKRAKKALMMRPIRAMVIGIPNVGKSSFINRMARKKKVRVENRPGVTKGKQWIDVGNGLELLDMPGVLAPKIEDKNAGEKLAFLGSINDNILDLEFLAAKLLKFIYINYRKMLINRYKIDENLDFENDFYKLLKIIGQKRGMFISGGEVDVERIAITFLDEFRNGKIGKISLENPDN